MFFVDSLLTLVKSKVWKCRKVAARCIYAVNSHPESEVTDYISHLLYEEIEKEETSHNAIHGLLLALEQFISADQNIEMSSNIQLPLITMLIKMNDASAAIAIGILSRQKVDKKVEDHVMSFIRKRIEYCSSSRGTEIGEMDLFNSISEYLIQNRAKCLPEILSILSNRSSQKSDGSLRRVFISSIPSSDWLISKCARGEHHIACVILKTFLSNFNFIRAITIAIDNLISQPKVTPNLKSDFENENFIKSIEDIIFCENLEDETLVAASSILVKIGKKNLIQKAEEQVSQTYKLI